MFSHKDSSKKTCTCGLITGFPNKSSDLLPTRQSRMFADCFHSQLILHLRQGECKQQLSFMQHSPEMFHRKESIDESDGDDPIWGAGGLRSARDPAPSAPGAGIVGEGLRYLCESHGLSHSPGTVA